MRRRVLGLWTKGPMIRSARCRIRASLQATHGEKTHPSTQVSENVFEVLAWFHREA